MANEFFKKLEKDKQDQLDYMESEEYKREMWEHQQDQWEKKAQKEGWHYQRKPFVSALDRQAAANQRKKEQIAELEEKLRLLKEDN